MITKNELSKALCLFNINFGLEIKDGYPDVIFPVVKSFSSEQFNKAISSFMLEKQMYKLPSVAQWMDKADIKTITRDDERDIACENFINKVFEYIDNICASEKDFYESLSDLEKTVLRRHGGIKELQNSICNTELIYRRSSSNVKKELKEDFLNSYKNNEQNKLENIDPKIKSITNEFLKKIN